MTRDATANIVCYGGPRPEGISEGRWRAMVRQVENNELRTDVPVPRRRATIVTINAKPSDPK